MSICEGCKKAADSQSAYTAGETVLTTTTIHPKDCGCPCNHRDVGTVEFERPK